MKLNRRQVLVAAAALTLPNVPNVANATAKATSTEYPRNNRKQYIRVVTIEDPATISGMRYPTRVEVILRIIYNNPYRNKDGFCEDVCVDVCFEAMCQLKQSAHNSINQYMSKEKWFTENLVQLYFKGIPTSDLPRFGTYGNPLIFTPMHVEYKSMSKESGRLL